MNTDLLLPRLCLLALLLTPAATLAAQVMEVRIYGLSGEPLANVRAYLKLEKSSRRSGLTAAQIREFFSESSREIGFALEPFGYYRPQIEKDLKEPKGPDDRWIATYRIDPGEVVPVADIQLVLDGAGADDAGLEKIAAGLPLRVGDGLDHRRYETSKRDLLQQLQDRGYRDAYLAAHRVEVDLVPYKAQVYLRVATGPRFVIGPIQFVQNEFDTDYLARFLLLSPGDTYNPAALAEQRRVLSRSGYFREVEIQPMPPNAAEPEAIPLNIRLVTFPPNRYRGRLSWGTDTDFGAQLDWNRRYVGGRGQHFNAGIAAVEDRNRLAADVSYVIPLQPLDGSKLDVSARHESKDLTFEDVELDEGGETRIETNLLSADWHLPHDRWGDFEVKPVVGLGLLGENYDVFEVLFGNLSKPEQQIIIDVIGRQAYKTLTPDFKAVIPKLRLTLRRSDDRLFIRNGDYLDLHLLGSSEALGSNITFWQISLDSWHIRSITERSRLLLRTGVGYSDAKSSEVLGVNFNEMPEYYEFRAGGARSVRGYSFESLFPRDSITGGKSELIGSIEYDYEVIPDWSVAFFVDAGNAFNRWEDYDARVGVGIGLRWRSPVGLARIDLGVPLDDSNEVFEIYITVGPEF